MITTTINHHEIFGILKKNKLIVGKLTLECIVKSIEKKNKITIQVPIPNAFVKKRKCM